MPLPIEVIFPGPQTAIITATAIRCHADLQRAANGPLCATLYAIADQIHHAARQTIAQLDAAQATQIEDAAQRDAVRARQKKPVLPDAPTMSAIDILEMSPR